MRCVAHGRYYSEGCKLTSLLLVERGMSVLALEQRLVGPRGKTLARGVLHRLLVGDRRMSLVVATQIETILGVSTALWNALVKARPVKRTARRAGRRSRSTRSARNVRATRRAAN